jgi:hypothetical protein
MCGTVSGHLVEVGATQAAGAVVAVGGPGAFPRGKAPAVLAHKTARAIFGAAASQARHPYVEGNRLAAIPHFAVAQSSGTLEDGLVLSGITRAWILQWLVFPDSVRRDICAKSGHAERATAERGACFRGRETRKGSGYQRSQALERAVTRTIRPEDTPVGLASRKETTGDRTFVPGYCE